MSSEQARETDRGSGRAASGARRTASSPPSEQHVSFVEGLLTFAVLTLVSWLGIDLSQHSAGAATIWFSNGLLFALMIRKVRRLWPLLLLLGLAADILADMFFGDTFRVAVGVSLANTVEVVFATLVLAHRFGSPLNLSRLKPLIGFLLIAIFAAPALSGSLGASWLLFCDPSHSWTRLFHNWFLGDSLGMAIVAPLVFVLQRPGFFTLFAQGQILKTLLIVSVPVAVTIYVFTDSSESVIFAIMPALLFVVFRLGFPGSALAVILIACIAITLTITGHGPLQLNSSATLQKQIIIVQFFIAVALDTCFPVAALLERHKWLEGSLLQSEARFRKLANTDALTGQPNRRAFDERLQTEWHTPLYPASPLVLLSIDIDHFKSYNDLYGHPAGDECLCRIATAAAIALLAWPGAALYRVGGEEFAAVLPCSGPGLPPTLAHDTAEAIRQTVFDLGIDHIGNPIGRQTVSIGLAATLPAPEGSVLALVELADQALYTAKHRGRNRVETAPQHQREPLAPSVPAAMHQFSV